MRLLSFEELKAKNPDTSSEVSARRFTGCKALTVAISSVSGVLNSFRIWDLDGLFRIWGLQFRIEEEYTEVAGFRSLVRMFFKKIGLRDVVVGG